MTAEPTIQLTVHRSAPTGYISCDAACGILHSSMTRTRDALAKNNIPYLLALHIEQGKQSIRKYYPKAAVMELAKTYVPAPPPKPAPEPTPEPTPEPPAPDTSDYLPLRDILPPGAPEDNFRRARQLLAQSAWDYVRRRTVDGQPIYHTGDLVYMLRLISIPTRHDLAPGTDDHYLRPKYILPYPSFASQYKRAKAILYRNCKHRTLPRRIKDARLYSVSDAKRLLKKHGLEYNPNL